MFTGSTKNPPAKTPQPERLDEVFAALRRGLQSYLQVHQLELESLSQQIRENKRNGRLGSLYELDKQVKAIERFMRRLEFHLSKVEELYDAYCIQRRLRDGASKMVAAFNSATGSKEARESLSEANKGYRECTERMCSLENELESQMGEFHIKMKGLAGFARLCAGDQYEVLMRYGRQRWRLRGRVEVSSKQLWDSDDYIFTPLITDLLSIKVTELKSLANHVIVGSVSCEMLDLFCPLPQTLAVDINDLGTVKLNLEVSWSPFDKDDQTTSSSTVSKRLLSNQSPPDTPSMREQVFYSLFKRQGELDNGTVWSNSSESSDDSSSPAMGHHAHRLVASHALQATPTTSLSFARQRSSASTPSLSSNQEEDECSVESPVPNGRLLGSASESPAAGISDSPLIDVPFVQLADLSETSEGPSCSYLDVCIDASDSPEAHDASTQQGCRGTPVAVAMQEEGCEATRRESDTKAGANTEEHGEASPSSDHDQRYLSVHACQQSEEPQMVRCQSSSSFTQEVETALESFDFLNCSDLDEDEEEEQDEEEEEDEEAEVAEVESDNGDVKDQFNTEEVYKEEDVEKIHTGRSNGDGDDDDDDDAEEETGCLDILMEAPEGFRNSDEECYCQSQGSSMEDLQHVGEVKPPEDDKELKEKGDK